MFILGWEGVQEKEEGLPIPVGSRGGIWLPDEGVGKLMAVAQGIWVRPLQTAKDASEEILPATPVLSRTLSCHRHSIALSMPPRG